MSFDSAERAWLAPPEAAAGVCRNCSHHAEDHDVDGRCLVMETVQRWRYIDGQPTPYGRRVRCNCVGFETRTREDDAADAADAAWDARDDRYWLTTAVVVASLAGLFAWLAGFAAVVLAAALVTAALWAVDGEGRNRRGQTQQ